VLAATFLVGFVGFIVRRRSANRRRAAVDSGGTARGRALLSLAGERMRRGRLEVSERHVEWRSLLGPDRVELSSARVLSAAIQPTGLRTQPDDTELRLELPDGTGARLILHTGDATLLVRVLDGRGREPAGRPTGTVEKRRAAPSRRRWPLVSFGLAALWLVAWLVLLLGGRTVDATVTGGDGAGVCDVVWTDPDGTRHSATVDCADEAAGSRRAVWALGPPLRGEAVDQAWTTGGILVVALLLATPGAVGYLLHRRDRARRARRRDAVDTMGPARRSATPELAELTERDVVPAPTETATAFLSRLAPYAARQARRDDWVDPRRPGGATPRPRYWQVARSFAGPAVALGLVLLLTAPWPYRWWVLQHSSTATARAISTGEVASSGPWLVPEEVSVRHRDAGGVEHQVDVAVLRYLPAGQPLSVTYATDAPGWARVEGDADGLDLGALLALVGVVLTLGWAGFRALTIGWTQRMLGRAARNAPRPALGLVTSDPMGAPMLLVCDPVIQPVELRAVPLRTPLPAAALAAEGPLWLRTFGALTAGAAVVSELVDFERELLVPAGPVLVPDCEFVLWLLDSARYLTSEFEKTDDRDGDQQ